MEAQENHAAKATAPAENFKPFEIAPDRTETLNSLSIGKGPDTADQTRLATQDEVDKKTIPPLGIDFGNNSATVAFFNNASMRGTTGDASASPNPLSRDGRLTRGADGDANPARPADGVPRIEDPASVAGEPPLTREGRDQRPGSRGGRGEVNPAPATEADPSRGEGRPANIDGRGEAGPASGAEVTLARAGGRDQRPGRGAHPPVETRPRPAREGRHEHPPGRGHAGEAELESPVKVDRNPSAKFVDEARATTESVRAQMPPHIREMLKDIHVTPVKSIKDKESGDTVNGAFGEGELLLAEKRNGNAKLESVLKHEFGHAFDEARPGEKPLSADPEFRKLVDAKTPKEMLKKMAGEEKDTYYAEVFADLFAANMKAPGRDLAIPNLDRRMPLATDWVKRKMQP